MFPKQTGPLLHGVLSPDWIKLTGIPVFSLLLHEQWEERHMLLVKHSLTEITVEIETDLTLTAALIWQS